MTSADIWPTAEQQAVVETCAVGANVVLVAGAGTGKTSTLRFAAKALDRSTGLYLACNRSTADSARRTFPRSVTSVTAHALAYRATGYRYADRLPGHAARMPSWAVANQLGIGSALPVGKNLLLTPAHLARIVMGTIEKFCHSADTEISATHIPAVHGVDEEAFAELTWRIVPLAQRAWLDVQQPGGRLPFAHDHYLKMWQLAGPVIAADYVMFDEAQDANPVTAAILQSQRGGQQIIVGDPSQAIYGWRGAIDALDDWPADTRLYLTQSFRFGPAVADEANKWLETLRAPYFLAGTPAIASVVGAVTDPQAILCRTNAEAFTQARAATEAGRRAALGGGAGDLKSLAAAALDLQAAGQTRHPELAAFRSWGAVQDYVRTDAAGADLAAAVRLIDKHGASTILGAIDRLTRETGAEVVACTVHAAKGREWDRVLIAGDFPPPSAGSPVPRAEAMRAYVAVTRARSALDRAGLEWIDNHRHAASHQEVVMNTHATSTAQPLDEPDAGTARPYAGGRAQAESGSRIIAADYSAWTAVGTTLPADHPEVTQLKQAWRPVAKRGLEDDPGPAAIRYRILAHAASALAATGDVQAREVAALQRLADHGRLHAGRLGATAEHLFLQSRLAGPYTGGLKQAASGSRIVETNYLAWSRSPSAAGAAADDALRADVKRLAKAWEDIRQHGLDDGPAPAAGRYAELAVASGRLADEFSPGLPSVSLWLLLDLSVHARKHSIRLHATADARDGRAGGGEIGAEVARFEVPVGYSNRPADDAGRGARTGSASDKTKAGSERVSNREARVRRHSRRQPEQER